MRKNKFLLCVTILVYFFIFAPLVMIALTSFTTESYISFPPVGFSLKWYAKVFETKSFMDSLYYSVVVIRAPLQGLCYTVRDAVDWFVAPTTRWFLKGSNHSPLHVC